MPVRSFSLPAVCFALLVSAVPRLMAVDIAVTPGTFSSTTTLVDGDTWVAGDVTINTGIVVTVPAAGTLTFQPGADRNLNGSGTLQIDATGRFLHATTTGGDNLIFAGAASLINDGTYEFASGGDVRLSNSGSSFTNNGLILKSAASVGASLDPSYIFRNSPTTGGTFLNTGDITVNAGTLNIAGGSSTGGNFTTSGSGILSFSGRWTELTGVASNSGGGSIILSNDDPAGTTGGLFVADAAVTTLNVTGTGLGLGAAVNISLNGNTLRNAGILTLSTGTTNVTGTGSFENTGEFRMTRGTLNLNSSDLVSTGLMSLNAGVNSVVIGGTASIVNETGGTFTLSSGTLTMNSTDVVNRGTMNLTAGANTVTLGGTASLVNDSGGTFNLNSGTLNAGAPVLNKGQMNLVTSVTFSGAGPVTNDVGGVFSLRTGTLTLNGVNVINNGTAEFDLVDGNVTITGTGRFINNTTFNHNYGGSNDNLILNGSATFENNGTFDFKERGDLQALSSAVVENNGLIVKSVAGSDPTFIFRDATGAATTFIAAAGSELRSNAGVLHVAVGGTSDPAALWTADGGFLDIAGQWTGTVAGSSANGGRVRITSSTNGSVASNLLIGAGGLTLDIGGDGLYWDQATIGTQGNTVTNEGTFTVVSGANKNLTGGGELVNASGATLNFSSGDVIFADGSIIRNHGSMNLTSGGASTFADTGSLINDTDGSANWSGGTFTVTAPAEFHNLGTFDITGTAGRTLSGTGVIANDSSGVMNWTSTGTVSIDATANLVNDGTFNVINVGNRTFAGAGTFTNNGTFNQSITDDSGDNLGWNGAGQFINNGLFAFTDNGDYEIEGGHIFTNTATGTIRVNTTAADQAQFFSFASVATAGTFDNQGTVEVVGGNFRVTGAASGATFDNVTLAQNDGSGTLTGGTWIANSTTTGTATIDLDAFGDASGIATIGQNAIVDLTGSGANLLQLSSLDTVDGQLYVNGSKSLAASGSVTVNSTGVLGGDGALTASLLVSGGLVTPGASMGSDIGILTLGSTAAFDAGSTIDLTLGAPLGSVNGMLSPTDMALAILALGDLDPTGGQQDALEVGGALTFTPGMSINVFNSGLTLAPGQFFDLLDFVGAMGGVTSAEAEALLDLPDPGPYAWDKSLFHSDGIVFVTAVVPEPSRALCAMLGLMALGLRRRRS